jgi:hypothetical protein
MADKYAEELQKERKLISNINPFKSKKKFPQRKFTDKERKSVPFVNQENKSENYFNLILGSDFRDIEMQIRGLKYYKDIDESGKEVLIMKKVNNHYLSDEGAEELIFELISHLNSDIKLGFMSRDEFLQSQEIICKFFISYITNNLYKLGMDTEEKQRKSPTLTNAILLRIRSVYSRSIGGKENERSHGDIKLSGDLDMQKEDRFRLEDMKN